jgi:hypothetical protein
MPTDAEVAATYPPHDESIPPRHDR